VFTDADDCGFGIVHESKGADSKSAAHKPAAAARRRRKLGGGKQNTHSLQRRAVNMRDRYVQLLNNCIVRAPTHYLSTIIRDKVCAEVADARSVGMKVWYTKPLARAGVLCELLEEALHDKATPLRLLLLDRFFESQSKPNTVVTLLPAIAHLHHKTPSADARVRARDEQMRHLLESAMQLLIKSVRTAINAKLPGGKHHEDKRSSSPVFEVMRRACLTHHCCAVLFGFSLDGVEEFAAPLREFLARAQICLLTPRKPAMASAAGAALLAKENEKQEKEAKEKSKVDEKAKPDEKTAVAPAKAAPAAAAVVAEDDENGSESDLDIEFALNHALNVINTCQTLLNEACAKLTATGVAADVFGYVSTLLKSSVGAVLVRPFHFFTSGSLLLIIDVRYSQMPLMSGLWSVELDISRASRLLPPLQKLLVCLDRLARSMPDVVKEEEQALKGKTQRLVISRTSAVESEHPTTQGNTERKLTIPGVREMTLGKHLSFSDRSGWCLHSPSFWCCWQRSTRAHSRTTLPALR
jgi:hypothetical protein